MNDALIVFNESTLGIDLELLLVNAGIDLSKWGKDATKTVTHLIKEIREKESRFFVDKDKELVREIIVGAVTVTYTDETGTYILEESHQDFENGATRTRGWKTSVSEKGILGEEPIDIFKRALQQELSQIKDLVGSDGEVLGPNWANSLDFNYMGPPELKTHYSSSYPGLKTRRIIHEATVEISKEHFNPKGYYEVQDGLTTYFTWTKVE